MAKQNKKEPGRLIVAATALEEELRRLGSTAREAQRLPLDSERNIERTLEKLAELTTVDAKLQPLVNELMGAVNELVLEQQAQAAAVAARAEELQRRQEAFRTLMGRYEEVGRATQELNALVRTFAGGEAPGSGSLELIRDTIVQLIEAAKLVFQAAKQEEFEDIARQADQLRQQLVSARSKVSKVIGARHPEQEEPTATGLRQ
ncbi:MAG TPA: hypothetical protein VNX25_01230 [Verrucomicrobiae bacterium]|nr:hypothetical protein [Verrucomicrobiae bacterium]